MTRIFLVLACVTCAFVVATAALGLSLRATDIRDAQDLVAMRWATVHRLAGLAAGLTLVFINGVVVTYFIGTCRWAKEVSETYSLDPGFVRQMTRLKRRAFPVALLGMLVAVGIVALGAAADPMASLRTQPPGPWSWTNMHFAGASLGIAFFLFAFVSQWNLIYANHTAIGSIVSEVRRIRAENGWDSADNDQSLTAV